MIVNAQKESLCTTRMQNKCNLRWAFNARNWNPTESELLASSSFIQPEEKLRISKYVFQDDAKSSLVGRLMLRKFVHLSTAVCYKDIRFGRDDRGKPYLLETGDATVSFNISHQGDFVVLAGNTEKSVGIDVMKIEPPINKNIPDFFRLMKRQFSSREWNTIKSFPNEMEQIACFYRIWCLKESYVKNVGLGITVPLDEISFCINTMKLSVGEIVATTVLYENNVLKSNWTFEETLLDEKHAATVSIHNFGTTKDKPASYEFLSFQDIIKDAQPLTDTDARFASDFMEKKIKDF